MKIDNIKPLPATTCKSIHCPYLYSIRVGDSFDRADEIRCSLARIRIDSYAEHGMLKKPIPDWCPRRKLKK